MFSHHAFSRFARDLSVFFRSTEGLSPFKTAKPAVFSFVLIQDLRVMPSNLPREDWPRDLGEAPLLARGRPRGWRRQQ